MDALLLDLPRVNELLSGNAAEGHSVIAIIRKQFPKAWELNPEYKHVSVGQVVEELVKEGKATAKPPEIGQALQLLCQALGEPLDTSSFDDVNMISIFAAAALERVPE